MPTQENQKPVISQMETFSRTTTIIAAHINIAKPLRSEVCRKSMSIDTTQRIQIPHILTYLIAIFLKLAHVKAFY